MTDTLAGKNESPSIWPLLLWRLASTACLWGAYLIALLALDGGWLAWLILVLGAAAIVASDKHGRIAERGQNESRITRGD